MKRRILVLFAILFITLVAIVLLRQPSLARNWDEDVKVLAEVTIDEDTQRFTISNVRNWRYDLHEERPEYLAAVSSEYYTETYNFEDLEGSYLYEQVLDSFGMIAHTFIVFEFSDSYEHPRLGVSVETRREVGEQYSLLKGSLRGFELTHVWATEEDLVQRRVAGLNYDLTRYRVDQPLELQRAYLFQFLRDTQQLAVEPKWYNTFRTNCTNVIINTANEIQSGFLPFDKSFVLTGYAAEYLRSQEILSNEPGFSISQENIESFMRSLSEI